MSVFVGCDVSQAFTHISVVDAQGKQTWCGKVKTCPQAIAAAVKEKASTAVKVGMESGALSPWLYHALKELGLPIICIDARHAKAGLKLQGITKTDKKDAQGIARIMQTGWYREVSVKELDGQTNQTALKIRKLLIKQRTECTNFIRGTLKAFGTVLPLGKLPALETLEIKNTLLVKALAAAYATLDSLKEQIKQIDIKICAVAAQDQRHALLQTIPGIGPITAFAVINTIGDPARFKKSRTVGAYLGLTEKRDQSGEKGVGKGISKCGDPMTRSYLYEAAGTLLFALKETFRLTELGPRDSPAVGIPQGVHGGRAQDGSYHAQDAGHRRVLSLRAHRGGEACRQGVESRRGCRAQRRRLGSRSIAVDESFAAAQAKRLSPLPETEDWEVRSAPCTSSACSTSNPRLRIPSRDQATF
jgi:transposase